VVERAEALRLLKAKIQHRRRCHLKRHQSGEDDPPVAEESEKKEEWIQAVASLQESDQSSVKREERSTTSGSGSSLHDPHSHDTKYIDDTIGMRHGSKVYRKTVVTWSCTACERECLPIREESRCLWCVEPSWWRFRGNSWTRKPTLWIQRALQWSPLQTTRSADWIPHVRVHHIAMCVPSVLLRGRGGRVGPALPVQTQTHGPRRCAPAVSLQEASVSPRLHWLRQSVGLQLQPPVAGACPGRGGENVPSAGALPAAVCDRRAQSSAAHGPGPRATAGWNSVTTVAGVAMSWCRTCRSGFYYSRASRY
jgi:hypothetical protein